MEEKQNRPESLPAPEPAPSAEAGPRETGGTGYLIVRVTTARGAIPLEGARVDIRTCNEESEVDPSVRGDIVASLVSGRDGSTVRVPLSTAPAAASETPGVRQPFARYSAEVAMTGYRRQTYIGIPVFDGITSIQQAILTPLPEDGTGGTGPMEPQYFPESGYPQL